MFNFLGRSIKLNDVENRTWQLDVERSAARVLAEFSIDLWVRHWTSDETALVEVSRHGVIASYEMAWLPRATLSEVSRLDRRDSEDRLLIVSQRIATRTADSLRDAKIDYIDDAGNAHLDFGQVLIDVRGRRSTSDATDARGASLQTGDANLFSAKRMQVIFALLAWPDIAEMGVRDIASAAGTSVGIAQSTLETLKVADYMIGRSLRRREELLDLWTSAFRSSLLPKLKHRSFAGDIESWSPTPGYLVSGESAVELIRRPETLIIYVKEFDLTEAVRNGWRRSDVSKIQIRQQFWEQPFWGTAPQGQHPFVRSSVPPVLVYADLVASKEPRQSEVARTLRAENLV